MMQNWILELVIRSHTVSMRHRSLLTWTCGIGNPPRAHERHQRHPLHHPHQVCHGIRNREYPPSSGAFPASSGTGIHWGYRSSNNEDVFLFLFTGYALIQLANALIDISRMDSFGLTRAFARQRDTQHSAFDSLVILASHLVEGRGKTPIGIWTVYATSSPALLRRACGVRAATKTRIVWGNGNVSHGRKRFHKWDGHPDGILRFEFTIRNMYSPGVPLKAKDSKRRDTKVRTGVFSFHIPLSTLVTLANIFLNSRY